MGKKVKTGKQRKDKFYHLAKETGYRSRSSFKLIQLNRKFEFLQKARVLIDLCAAPGGWLQVAHKYMPVSSFIIGIDLVPIKPISNVITFQEDITTDSCRKALKREMKTWKADVILHDGAPNLGKNWIHDAFSQSLLTLNAVKIASEFLVKGGWFITKVFRSKDYHALLWVFKKLFKKVHATKPKASRSESAEIFVVCQSYISPDKIDPKFFDPTYLFEEVEQEGKAKLFLHSGKKVKAEGYPENDYTLFHSLPASLFLKSNNHIELLSKASEVVLDESEIINHPLTSEDIKEYCKDIKVLGKSEIRSLLNWRKSLKLYFAKQEDHTDSNLIETTCAEFPEEDAILKEIDHIQAEKLQELKRKKKIALKRRQKLQEKINLNMVIKNDEPVIDDDIELFRLSQIRSQKDLSKIDEDSAVLGDPNLPVSDTARVNFIRWLSYNKDEKPEAWHEELQSDPSESESCSEKNLEFSDDEENDSEINEVTDEPPNPLLKGINNKLSSEQISEWFTKDSFAEVEDDLELESLTAEEDKIPSRDCDELSLPEDQNEVPSVTNRSKIKRKKIKLDAMGLALGSLMIQSQKKKREVIDDGFNRYMFNDENLPDWFIKDEEKHYRKQLPVTATMVAECRERMKEINARPIKKVAEAKARKKKRALKRLDKARKKAESVTESLEMTDKEKMEHIRSIYKKALQKKEKQLTYVVAKKGLGKKVKRPPGVKGRFKLVDPRLKKDNKRKKEKTKNRTKSRK